MPSSSASAIRAWPIETSSTPGTAARKAPRLSRLRSWPALTPRPTRCAAAALAAKVARTSRLARRAPGLCVRLGVELDAIGADRLRPRHRRRIGVDEEADANAERARLGDQRREARRRRRRGPSRGPKSPAARCRGRTCTASGRSSRTSGIRFWYGLPSMLNSASRPVLQQRGELAHVAGADVALVGSRMDGDAVRAGLERDRRQADHARDRERALVAQQRDLVDVDRQRGERPRRVSRPVVRGGSSVERLRFDHHLARAQLRSAEMIVKLGAQERAQRGERAGGDLLQRRQVGGRAPSRAPRASRR